MSRCPFCPDPITDADYYVRVVGWERKRSEGGTNQLALREVVDSTVAHSACIRREVNRRKAGVSEAQGSLL